MKACHVQSCRRPDPCGVCRSDLGTVGCIHSQLNTPHESLVTSPGRGTPDLRYKAQSFGVGDRDRGAACSELAGGGRPRVAPSSSEDGAAKRHGDRRESAPYRTVLSFVGPRSAVCSTVACLCVYGVWIKVSRSAGAAGRSCAALRLMRPRP